VPFSGLDAFGLGFDLAFATEHAPWSQPCLLNVSVSRLLTIYSKDNTVVQQRKQAAGGQRNSTMRFGERVRELRQASNLTQRDLGAKVGVEFSYISKIENEKLDFGDVPSERLIQKLAEALHADEYELLVLAEKVPPEVRKRFFERPDAFRVLARLDDKKLDGVLASVGEANVRRRVLKKAR